MKEIFIFTVITAVGFYYLVRKKHKLDRAFGSIQPWEQLSPQQKLVRNLILGIPLIWLIFVLSKSPGILVVGVAILLANIFRFFKQGK